MLALALAVRIAPWQRFFTGDGVLLAADGDTYYHALRAERIARDWPRVPWTDPGMNHPYGAEVPWPPLLDEMVATIAVATGPATQDHVAAVAALLPPVLGALVVALAAALGAVLLGGPTWWDAALLVALLAAPVRQSFVGRADHHVLEVLLGAAAFLAYASAFRRERPGWARPLLLGAALALSFWSWTGSALALLVLAAHVAAVHVASPAGDPGPARAAGALAAGAAAGALLLAITVGAFGPPGSLASARLTPIGGLSVALCAGTAAGAALVLAARRWDAGAGSLRRLAHVASIALVPAVAVLAAPALLPSGVAQGLTAVSASSPWYATIREFWPLLLSGRQPWTTEVLLAAFAFGLTPLALPLAGRALHGAWAHAPERRAGLAFLAVWTVATLGLALLRRRFEGYAALPLAIAAAWALREIVPSLAARLGPSRRAAPALTAAGLLAFAAPALPVTLTGAVAELPAGAADKYPLLAWLRDVQARPGREGVLSEWGEGHEVQWFARKPVVSTPFGTDIDPRSVEDEAAFYTEIDPARAEAVLRRREVGFLLLGNPVREVATMAAFAPGAPRWAVEDRGLRTGSTYAMRPEFFALVVSRLWFLDGASPTGQAPSLGAYRLLGESRTTVEVLGLRAQAYKLFGVVEGARIEVRGARPRSEVSAVARVVTELGRGFAWRTREIAGADGTAILRVPYATGANGTSLAGPYEVGDGERKRTIAPTEGEVEGGARILVDLGT